MTTVYQQYLPMAFTRAVRFDMTVPGSAKAVAECIAHLMSYGPTPSSFAFTADEDILWLSSVSNDRLVRNGFLLPQPDQ